MQTQINVLSDTICVKTVEAQTYLENSIKTMEDAITEKLNTVKRLAGTVDGEFWQNQLNEVDGKCSEKCNVVLRGVQTLHASNAAEIAKMQVDSTTEMLRASAAESQASTKALLAHAFGLLEDRDEALQIRISNFEKRVVHVEENFGAGLSAPAIVL